MDIYEKMLLAGLGLAGASAKEIRKTLKTIAGKNPSEKEWGKTLDAWAREGQSRRQEAEQKARALVKKVLQELDLPTRSELKALEKKLSRRAKN